MEVAPANGKLWGALAYLATTTVASVPAPTHAALWWLGQSLLAAFSLHPAHVCAKTLDDPEALLPADWRKVVSKRHAPGGLCIKWNGKPLEKTLAKRVPQSNEAQAMDILRCALQLIDACNPSLRRLPPEGESLLRKGVHTLDQAHEILAGVDPKVAAPLNARMLEIATPLSTDTSPRPRL